MKKVFMVSAIIYSGDGTKLKTKIEICGIFSTIERANFYKAKEEVKYSRADLIIEEFPLNPKN